MSIPETEYNLRVAYRAFRGGPVTESSVKALAVKAADIAGWHPDAGRNARIEELLWELGLLLERKSEKGTERQKPRLTANVFVRYVQSLSGIHRCVPLAVRHS